MRAHVVVSAGHVEQSGGPTGACLDEDGTQPVPQEGGDELFDIISRTLGTDERPVDTTANDRTGAVPLDDGLIPPADVGGERQTGTRRTTLFDFLVGG